MLVLFGSFASSPDAWAESSNEIPWSEQPSVLNEEIKEYVEGTLNLADTRVKPGGSVRILYLGFAQDDISRNAQNFPEISEHNVFHLPYGRIDYYDTPVDLLDYQKPDSITVLNVDMSSEISAPNIDNETNVVELLAPNGGYIQELAQSIYHVMKIMAGSGTVTELGRPMDRFASEEFTVRQRLFDQTCTSVFEFFDENNGEQHNSMIIYSDYQPGSDEQIACVVKHALIFMRPETPTFSSIID